MMDVQTGSPACAYSPVAPAAEHEFGTVGGCWPLSSARENLLLTRRPLWLRSWLSRRRAQTRSLAGGWGAGGTIGESNPIVPPTTCTPDQDGTAGRGMYRVIVTDR
jgi:hypothetical protein